MPASLRPVAAVAALLAATAAGWALAQYAPIVAQDLLIEEQPMTGGTRVTISELTPGRDGALVAGPARRYSEARP